jgi:NAD(P)-dependent dehydrogenase (short-subunit alcohol dehydrogenase family)
LVQNIEVFSQQMDKKVVLLTGASGGLGSALADLLSKNYRLILQYNQSIVKTPESTDVIHVQADLCKEADISNLVKKGVEKFGGIDVLINNAGVSHSSMSWKTEAESWRKTMAVNLDAPFFLSKEVIPHMRKQGSGRIINISSVVASTGVIGTSAYAASKAGLLGLTKTMSKELAHFGITVNALSLGYMDRGMISDVPDEQVEELKKQVPMNRLGTPKEIFKTMEWILSDEGAYITGQTVHINGGLYV